MSTANWQGEAPGRLDVEPETVAPSPSAQPDHLALERCLGRAALESERRADRLAGESLDAAAARDLDGPAIPGDARGFPEHGADLGTRSPDLPWLVAAAEIRKPARGGELRKREGACGLGRR